MNIKVLGTGCKKCKELEANTREAIKIAEVEAEIEKVEDIQSIMSYGVMSTPALVVDGEVKSVGKLLKPEEIVKMIK